MLPNANKKLSDQFIFQVVLKEMIFLPCSSKQDDSSGHHVPAPVTINEHLISEGPGCLHMSGSRITLVKSVKKALGIGAAQ